MKNLTVKLIIVLALISIGSGFFLALTMHTIPILRRMRHRAEAAILETFPMP